MPLDDRRTAALLSHEMRRIGAATAAGVLGVVASSLLAETLGGGTAQVAVLLSVTVSAWIGGWLPPLVPTSFAVVLSDPASLPQLIAAGAAIALFGGARLRRSSSGHESAPSRAGGPGEEAASSPWETTGQGALAELRASNEKLQRANQDLEQFAYVASHDLQEPLRKLQTFADRLEQRHAHQLDDSGREMVQRMRAAAARMSTLINDLLTLSRVGRRDLELEGVDLATTLAEVTRDLESAIEESGATITAAFLPTLRADPLQMRQLLQNLIGNSIKYARKGVPPEIEIAATPSGGSGCQGDSGATLERPGWWTIEITDNGIGFDPRYSDQIFVPFQRLHGRFTYGGSGIGLAVCSRIVQRHGGSIRAEGEPGRGARFVVTLPAAAPAAADADLAEAPEARARSRGREVYGRSEGAVMTTSTSGVHS